MSQIPMGDFAQARVVPRPNTTRIDNSASLAVGRALTNLGATIGQVGELAARKQQEADESALMDFENTLVAERNRLLEDPNEGAVTRRGRNAIGIEKEFIPQWEEVRDEQLRHLPASVQDRARQLADRHGQSLRLGLARHESKEADSYHAETSKAGVALAIDDAISKRGDPDAMYQSMQRGLEYSMAEWDRLGIVGEQQRKLRADLFSDMHRRVIEATLAEDPVAGLESLEQYRKYLTAADATEMAELTAPVVREEATYEAGMAAVYGGAIPGMPTVRTDADHASDAPAVQARYKDIGERHGFTTTSTTRTPEQNKAVNGVANSQHLTQHGTARDWSIKGKTKEQVAAFTGELKSAGFRVLLHDAGSGMHVHAELPKVRRERGTPHAAPARSESEAIERLRSSPIARNPADLRRAEAIARQEWRYQEAQDAEADKQTGDMIYAKVMASAPNAPLRNVLSPDELHFMAQNPGVEQSINRYREYTAAGGVIKDDPATVDSIYRMMADDPARFAKLPLAQYADKLSGRTLLSFRGSQAEANKSEKVEQWATEGEVLSLARADLGLNDADSGEFKLAYFREKRAFVAQHKREPNADEMQVLVNRLKQPFVRRKWWGGTETRRLYEGPEAGFTVPADARAQIVAALRDAGVTAPTEQQIVSTYLENEDARL